MAATAIFQRINIGEDINNELGISEKAKPRTYTPQTSVGIMSVPSSLKPFVVPKTDIRTGGVRPTKATIIPVPPRGSDDGMPKTPVVNASVAPAPLPAMDTKTEEKKELNAAPKNKLMLWLGIAAIVGVGYYIIKK